MPTLNAVSVSCTKTAEVPRRTTRLRRTGIARSADQGHAGAQFNLGHMYANGQGVPQDDAAAANWYRRAADQGHTGAQLAYFDKAITLDPNNPSFFFGRAVAYASNGDFTRAIADYDEAIRLNPNDPHTYYKRGNAYEDMGDYDRAIADYDYTISLDPKAAVPYYRRGLAYAHQGQHNSQSAISTRRSGLTRKMRISSRPADGLLQ